MERWGGQGEHLNSALLYKDHFYLYYKLIAMTGQGCV